MKTIRKGKTVAIASGLIVAGVIFLGALSWREIAARYYVAKLDSQDERECKQAISSLAKIGPSGVPGLLRALKDQRPAARDQAAEAIAHLRPVEPTTITKLVGLLDDEQEPTRAAAAFVLAQIGPKAREAIPKLIETLSDPDPDVRSNAINALAYIDREQFPSYPELLKKLNDESPQVRAHAAHALGAFAASGKDIGAAIPILTKNLADSFGPVRGMSAQAIKAAGPAAASSIPSLIVMARGTDKSVAVCALNVLGAIAPNQNVDLFINALKDADSEVSRVAIAHLSTIAGSPIQKTLLDAFKSGSAQFRSDMLNELKSRSPHAIPIFLEALKDPDPEIRIRVADSLGDLGPAAKEAIPALKSLEGDPSADVKNSVKVALEEIGKVELEPARGK